MATLVKRPNPMAKRLPRPTNPKRARCEIDDDELRAIENAANLCRLSVASFIRVALVETVAHSEKRVAAWLAVAAKLAASAPADRIKPGRPKKK